MPPRPTKSRPDICFRATITRCTSDFGGTRLALAWVATSFSYCSRWASACAVCETCQRRHGGERDQKQQDVSSNRAPERRNSARSRFTRSVIVATRRALMWPNPGFCHGLFPHPAAGFTKNYALACLPDPVPIPEIRRKTPRRADDDVRC